MSQALHCPRYTSSDDAMFMTWGEGLWPSDSGATQHVVKRHVVHDPMREFREYSEADWDGYGAEPITRETIEAARRFYDFIQRYLRRGLPEPDIAPGPDGTIGFEWRRTSAIIRKLFVEIGPDNNLRAYWVRASGKIEKQPASQQPEPPQTPQVQAEQRASNTVKSKQDAAPEAQSTQQPAPAVPQVHAFPTDREGQHKAQEGGEERTEF